MFFQSTTPVGAKEDEKKEDEKEAAASTSISTGPDGTATVLDAPVGSLTLERVDSSASSSSSGESGLVDENSVKRLMDMGFMADVSRATLLKHNGNETAAVNELLSSA